MTRKSGTDLDLLIIRHATSVANSKGKLAGRTEPNPLSPEGRKQAEQLSGVIEEFKPTLAFSSPMTRCKETLQLAGLSNFDVLDEIIEMDYGSWSNKSIKRLSLLPGWKRVQRDPLGFRFPDGESFEECRERLTSFRSRFSQWRGERIVICSHGDIIRILINELMGRQFAKFQQLHVYPASFSRFQIGMQRSGEDLAPVLLYLNRVASHPPISAAKHFQVGGE